MKFTNNEFDKEYVLDKKKATVLIHLDFASSLIITSHN